MRPSAKKEDNNRSNETQCSSLVLTNPDNKTAVADQQPCCSKSLAYQAIELVQESSPASSTSSGISEEESDVSISPAVQAYSDTAILCNNLEFERYSQQEEEPDSYDPDYHAGSESGSNESTEIHSDAAVLENPVSRKTPQVCLPESVDKDGSNSRILNLSQSESSDRVSNSHEEKMIDRDDNNNPVQWISNSEKKYLEHASYLFHRERRQYLAQTINLLPRSRQFVVFNVFGDFARFMGWRSRKRKKVAFPEEVMEHYHQKGDVAGKDRFVPVAKQAFKGIASTKKRRLSAVYTSFSVKSTEFLPRMERIEDYSKCEHCCERHCVHCDCFKRHKAKPDLTNLMEGYLCDLNGASLFLHGHATRTFESAMSTLEFFRPQPNNRSSYPNMTSSYSKYQLGVLSASVWMFGYSLRQIIQISGVNSETYNKTTIPSEIGFRKLLEQFAAMSLAVEEGVKVVLQHSHNFYHFCKECVRILKVLQIHVSFRCDIKIRLPIRRGDGLEVDQSLKKRDIVKQKAVEVMVARENQAEGEAEQQAELEWKKFGELTGQEKFYAMKHLLNVTLDGMNLVQTQLRFLIDDIVDSVKDVAEADLLFILADMYDRVKFLENVGNRSSTKAEMNQISRLMTEFCKDFQTFVDFGQHIMKRYIEFRDMMHLTYIFLTRGLKQEMLTEMVPGDTFKKKRVLRGCCGCGGAKSRRKTVTNYQPKYDPNDFFRVSYRDAVTAHAVIFANKFHVKLMAGVEPIQSIIPRKLQCSWGEMEGPSPRTSLDEYVELLETDEEHPPEPPKPILVSGPETHSPTGSPVGSPRGSLGDEGTGGSASNLQSSPPPPTSSSPPTKSPKVSIESPKT
ncbi:hypothetical protein Ocin01_06283 [Orchesella cincta]|uniref:Uncharacterized protein n=1 Tax=Orchesella cincta TaxID=48709 RepID=A0A1D2N554_ORCCI|nr:hypothetical protein Ocin01_06283 [Orchesella cincta]